MPVVGVVKLGAESLLPLCNEFRLIPSDRHNVCGHPLSRLGFEREWYFEDSHVGLSTMGSKDMDREWDRSILPHLF